MEEFYMQRKQTNHSFLKFQILRNKNLMILLIFLNVFLHLLLDDADLEKVIIRIISCDTTATAILSELTNNIKKKIM